MSLYFFVTGAVAIEARKGKEKREEGSPLITLGIITERLKEIGAFVKDLLCRRLMSVSRELPVE